MGVPLRPSRISDGDSRTVKDERIIQAAEPMARADMSPLIWQTCRPTCLEQSVTPINGRRDMKHPGIIAVMGLIRA